jgi:hypothetical protein
VDEAVVLPAQGVGTAALAAEVEVLALARGGGGMGMVDPAKGLAGLSADPAGLALAKLTCSRKTQPDKTGVLS